MAAIPFTPLYFPLPRILRYYDSRRFFEIISDSGVEETVASYQDNEAYQEAVRSAEAEVDENLQVGSHYDKQTLIDACTAADVAVAGGTVTAADVEIAQRRVAPLREMIAHLVFGKLMMRRGYGADKMRELSPMYDSALERLERLASGQRVFDFSENIAAGVPQRVGIGTNSPYGLNQNPLFGYWPTQGQTTGGYYPYGFGG